MYGYSWKMIEASNQAKMRFSRIHWNVKIPLCERPQFKAQELLIKWKCSSMHASMHEKSGASQEFVGRMLKYRCGRGLNSRLKNSYVSGSAICMLQCCMSTKLEHHRTRAFFIKKNKYGKEPSGNLQYST